MIFNHYSPRLWLWRVFIATHLSLDRFDVDFHLLFLDILTSLNRADSSCETLMPKRKYVLSTIQVPIQNTWTVFTFPYSYSQICSTFRTACSDLTTARTHLGCETFTNFFKPYSCVLAFILEHGLECWKSGIQNRLRHLGFHQFFRTQIAYNN